MANHDDDRLDRLLSTYKISIDTGDAQVSAMVRAARIRAVQLQQSLEERGFFGTVAVSLGFHHTTQAVWSGALGLGFAFMVGMSVGMTNFITHLDEHAFALDFDAVVGDNTFAAGEDLSL